MLRGGLALPKPSAGQFQGRSLLLPTQRQLTIHRSHNAGSITCRAGATKQSSRSMSPPVAVREGKVSSVLGMLALSGATTGTFLDGIHAKASVLVYDAAPLTFAGLHTSAWVPFLLAGFYVFLGGMVLLFDTTLAGSDPVTRSAMKGASLVKMVFSFAALAAMLELSAMMYVDDYQGSTICLALAACAAVNYLVFDSTKQGLALALLCALGAPLAELVLMQSLGLWHYPQGDLYPHISGGIVRWVPFCYFFYAPAVSNLTRYLWKVL